MRKFGLSGSERIKKKKDFELLYSAGKTVFSRNRKIKAVFYVEVNPGKCGVQTAYAVSRKAGKAVWRNRVKRLLREAYRLNKHPLTEKAAQDQLFYRVIFSPGYLNEKKNNKIGLSYIKNEVTEILSRITSYVPDP